VALIFDGTCGFCTWTVRLVQALDRRHRVTVAPFQKPGVPEAHGLTVAQCEGAAWAVTTTPHHRRYRGAGAVNAALSAVLGTAWPLRLYRLPAIRQLQDAVYTWIARNRSRFPGVTPYCEEYPAECR
jgi:predicted DCC family thiol-disulfide oxidoreductase YuxK